MYSIKLDYEKFYPKSNERTVQAMNKIYDGIMGLVVADALGVPYEFKKRGTFKAVDMVGFGTYNQPPGTWSDDSSMTLATLESIGRLGKIDPADIMENFSQWLNCGSFTPYGEVFDVGGGTRRAINRYSNGVEPLKCGGRTRMDNGNGSLMRILPLAFIPCSMNDINNVSRLTHAHEISLRACRLYIGITELLLKGVPPYLALSESGIFVKEFSRIPTLWKLSRDEINSSGYVVDTLEAALWCVLHGHDYKSTVLMAVNLGEDTDTVAAVAGGLAGIIYGMGDIPTKWLAQIPQWEWIDGLCRKVESSFSK